MSYIINAFFLDFFILFDNILSKIINILDFSLYCGFTSNSYKWSYIFPQNITINFAFKFLLSIALLILIRGGTPRYRYDYLSKLGWLKFLGFTIATFLAIIHIYHIF